MVSDVDQFMRQMTVQELSRDGLQNIGKASHRPCWSGGTRCTRRCCRTTTGNLWSTNSDERTISRVKTSWRCVVITPVNSNRTLSD